MRAFKIGTHMGTLLKPRFGYTEKEMADSFVRILRSQKGLPGIGPFHGVYREVSCHQGRPDFIALRKKQSHQRLRFPKSTGLVGPSVLAILRPRAPRTFDYLVNHSEFSGNSIKRSLQQLIASGHVEQTKTGTFHLGKAASQLQIELWSFELKLSDPKRAVFQAQQSRAYADRTIIVARPGQEKNYKRYIQTMTRWGIGLATFNMVTREFRLLRRGRRSPAFSPQHRLYAVSQLLSFS